MKKNNTCGCLYKKTDAKTMDAYIDDVIVNALYMDDSMDDSLED